MPVLNDYLATSKGLNDLCSKLSARLPFFDNLVSSVKAGDIKISLMRNIIYKKIEEEWIDAIEESIVSLDNVIRHPARFIEEIEEIKPIELSHNIRSRSIQHLAQHSDYISKITDDGMVIPNKILNVYHEETLQTYENKFVNTLIRQLFLFVNKRYNEMLKKGAESGSDFNLTADFKDGDFKSTIKFGFSVSESVESVKADPLLARVSRLNSVATMYFNSPFVKEMNGSYVRPPIMRTNALTKNRDLRQCMILWQFIESYQKVGYSISVERKALKPNYDTLDKLYQSLAVQYTVFRKEIAEAADTINEDYGVPFQPLFSKKLADVNYDSFNISESSYKFVTPISYLNPARKLSQDENLIRDAVDVALLVDAEMRKHDRVDDIKRRVADEARRAAVEKSRDLARLKSEEDRLALAEYFASQGYKVRLKADRDEEDIIVKPDSSSAQKTISADSIAKADVDLEIDKVKTANGLTLNDEEIAAQLKDGVMPSLPDLLGIHVNSDDIDLLDSDKFSLHASTNAKKRGSFVIAHFVPFETYGVGSENMSDMGEPVAQPSTSLYENKEDSIDDDIEKEITIDSIVDLPEDDVEEQPKEEIQEEAEEQPEEEVQEETKEPVEEETEEQPEEETQEETEEQVEEEVQEEVEEQVEEENKDEHEVISSSSTEHDALETEVSNLYSTDVIFDGAYSKEDKYSYNVVEAENNKAEFEKLLNKHISDDEFEVIEQDLQGLTKEEMSKLKNNFKDNDVVLSEISEQRKRKLKKRRASEYKAVQYIEGKKNNKKQGKKTLFSTDGKGKKDKKFKGSRKNK